MTAALYAVDDFDPDDTGTPVGPGARSWRVAEPASRHELELAAEHASVNRWLDAYDAGLAAGRQGRRCVPTVEPVMAFREGWKAGFGHRRAA